jgi:hypothetical protein
MLSNFTPQFKFLVILLVVIVFFILVGFNELLLRKQVHIAQENASQAINVSSDAINLIKKLETTPSITPTATPTATINHFFAPTKAVKKST